MQEFFNRELKRTDAKRVIATIEKMFKDIQNPKLRRYFVDYLTKHVRILPDDETFYLESYRL